MKDTKEKILAAALKLFNAGDTQKATTNHIAKAAGISPGNLYYHFRNKEAIIRELYARMTAEIGFEAKALPESMCEMRRYCTFVADVWWKYRFFRRELLFLMQRDPELEAAVVKDNRAQHAKLLSLVAHLERKGYLLLPYDDAIEELADAVMIYSQFWTPYLMSLGHPIGEAEVRRVSERILSLFFPWLSPMAKAELADCT